MAIFNEIKEKLLEDGLGEVENWYIIKHMAYVANNKYGVKTAAYIPKDKLNEYRDLVVRSAEDELLKKLEFCLKIWKCFYKKNEKEVTTKLEDETE